MFTAVGQTQRGRRREVWRLSVTFSSVPYRWTCFHTAYPSEDTVARGCRSVRPGGTARRPHGVHVHLAGYVGVLRLQKACQAL